MEEKSCSVFGHRDIEVCEELKIKLKTIFESLIVNHNVVIFYFGGFGDFDELCYEVISELKSCCKHIQRVYVLEEEKWQYFKDKMPKYLVNKYDEYVYFPTRYSGFTKRIYFRNCEIVDRSDVVIFYTRFKGNSGAYKILKYAQKKKKNIIQI